MQRRNRDPKPGQLRTPQATETTLQPPHLTRVACKGFHERPPTSEFGSGQTLRWRRDANGDCRRLCRHFYDISLCAGIYGGIWHAGCCLSETRSSGRIVSPIWQGEEERDDAGEPTKLVHQLRHQIRDGRRTHRRGQRLLRGTTVPAEDVVPEYLRALRRVQGAIPIIALVDASNSARLFVPVLQCQPREATMRLGVNPQVAIPAVTRRMCYTRHNKNVQGIHS